MPDDGLSIGLERAGQVLEAWRTASSRLQLTDVDDVPGGMWLPA